MPFDIFLHLNSKFAAFCMFLSRDFDFNIKNNEYNV